MNLVGKISLIRQFNS